MELQELYPDLIREEEIPVGYTAIGRMQFGTRLVLKIREYGPKDRPEDFGPQTIQERYVVDKNEAIMTFSEEECELFCALRNLECDSAIELFSHKGTPPQRE